MPNRVSARFGPFELDTYSGELHREGFRLRLQEQPLHLLNTLLEHPGDVVTREELKRRLWPSDTFVDFDHGLNAAVRRLRETLNDDADNPRYIETLPRHGYRFVAPVTTCDDPPPEVPRSRSPWQLWSLLILALSGAAFLAIGMTKWHPHLLSRTPAVAAYSLAVLPFENLSRKPEDEYFVDSLTAELINQLGRVRNLRVISRQSVMQYKGTLKTLPQIAHELKVQAIVQGSILRDEGRVHITLQLVRAVPEQHLWADSYERDLKDVIELEKGIAAEVARQVQVALAPPPP